MLGLAPHDAPSPMTREGTRALVDRFHAMKQLGAADSTPEVGAGGPAGGVGSTTLIPSGPKNLKSNIDSRPDEKTKRISSLNRAVNVAQYSRNYVGAKMPDCIECMGSCS